MTTPKDIIFLHPDLGVGGAERLVVDAALALKNNGHRVRFVTSHHNRDHCFQETKDGTLDVTVVGDWIPRDFAGRFFALFAYLKMIYCAFYILFCCDVDIAVCDLVSVCIPILKLKVEHVIFYCHFPDQLLSKPEGKLKEIYRIPLNWIEEKTTVQADKLYVNSKFTQNVFKTTFKKSMKVVPDVLYPSINTKAFDKVNDDTSHLLPVLYDSDDIVFLSINRYERKKQVELAIKSLNRLKKEINDNDWKRINLVVAGGYDVRVSENVEYHKEMVEIVSKFKLEDKVTFLKSPSDSDKIWLLRRCDCVIYTPSNEHFGIVPLEAMYCKKPVIACNSGGPTETIVDGVTGFLCGQNEMEFARAMSKFIEEDKLKSEMGIAGYNRFIKNFSFTAFSKKFNKDIDDIVQYKNYSI